MTAHELAKKLLDMPDVEVVYDDQRYGDLFVVNVVLDKHSDNRVIDVVKLL